MLRLTNVWKELSLVDKLRSAGTTDETRTNFDRA